ncbi:sugar phosphate isomerase/epimerase family protein [Streptomyces boninensis]|uniref:sugar phosphate isomerase/epimerase family protein n=1 Tax=Streptomyces boninensis TaxID=2039455 RepID=UPI003B228A0E
MTTDLRFAYGTNGFADHRLTDALHVLADLGYQGVSLTLDHHHLDPYVPDTADQLGRVQKTLAATGLAVVVETGARYLLDPWRKHRPTLLTADKADRARRQDLLRRAIDIASELGAECVHLWSGTPDPQDLPDDGGVDDLWRRLADGIARLLPAAEAAGLDLAFEPEPGMLVADRAGYRRLTGLLGKPDRLRLTLDIGHCRCLEPLPVPACVRASAADLAHVQIEDMRRGVHEHLPFGEGEIDFPPVLRALADVGYRGLVSVELPRHNHAATELARRSLEFLRTTQQQAHQLPPQQPREAVST